MVDYLDNLEFKASRTWSRPRKRYLYRGHWYTAAELARRAECVPCEGTLYRRLALGWGAEDAVNRIVSGVHREINKKRWAE